MSGVSTKYARPAPVEPCGRCGVRGDVDCKHRSGSGAKPDAIARPNDPGKVDGRTTNSIRGKAGNPTQGDVERARDLLK